MNNDEWQVKSIVKILHYADVDLKVDKNYNLRVSLWDILGMFVEYIFAYTRGIAKKRWGNFERNVIDTNMPINVLKSLTATEK